VPHISALRAEYVAVPTEKPGEFVRPSRQLPRENRTPLHKRSQMLDNPTQSRTRKTTPRNRWIVRVTSSGSMAHSPQSPLRRNHVVDRQPVGMMTRSASGDPTRCEEINSRDQGSLPHQRRQQGFHCRCITSERLVFNAAAGLTYVNSMSTGIRFALRFGSTRLGHVEHRIEIGAQYFVPR